MIFVSLANALFVIFSTLLGFINIPAFPIEFSTNVNQYIDMFINNGMSLLTFFVPSQIIKIGLPLVIVLIFAEQLYALVIWIIKKIPLLGMS